MQISAGKQLPTRHRIYDLIFSVSLSQMSRQELVTELFYFFDEDLKCMIFTLPSPLFINVILPVPVCLIH